MDLRLNVAHLPEGKVIAHPGGKASKGEVPYGPRGALEKEDTHPRAPLPHEPVVADALFPVLLVPEVGGLNLGILVLCEITMHGGQPACGGGRLIPPGADRNRVCGVTNLVFT